MAAFSYQQPFLLEPVFLPNNNTFPCFSQFYHPDPLQESPVDFSVHETPCLEQSTKAVFSSNEPNKHSSDTSSLVLDKLENSEQLTQNVIPMEKKRKNRDGSSFNSTQSKDTRCVKGNKQKKINGAKKDVEEKKPKDGEKKGEKKVAKEAPTGYIHVRARRGQATDSHSLAERVRREKISERMKLLQALVPGCDKVTGKALMLDEIINYVQSLQNQVELLSMKLASVNPLFYDFGMDLDTYMVRPEPNVQQCSPTQAIAFSNTTNTITTANNYPLLDSSASYIFQHGQMSNILSQSNGQLLWDVDEQRQKFEGDLNASILEERKLIWAGMNIRASDSLVSITMDSGSSPESFYE